MSAPIDLRQAVRNLNSLPAMPVIAQKLLALSLDSDKGEQEMMLLIGQDPLISAKLIGLANSPLFGTARKVTTIKDAAALLGLNRVKSVATSIALLAMMSKPIGRFDPEALWIHNMAVAFAMLPVVRAMPAANRPADDLIFLSGMLHDIGYMVLAHLDSEHSDDLHTRMIVEQDRPSIEVERELLEMTHDELGAELAKYWNLPSEIVSVLRYHHTPSAPEAEEARPLALILNLTERLVPSHGLSERNAEGIAPEEWESLGIDPERADEIAALAAEQADQATQFASSFS